ncbi:MAG: hypothetical protein LUQ25_03520, partial [Methanoregulaceae archaeon]|nr:hypothetical protein [Methanoregulaceae archaeon]
MEQIALQRGVWPEYPLDPPVLELFPDGTVSEISREPASDRSVHERVEVMVDGSGDGHYIAMFPGDDVYIGYERGISSNDAEFNAVILALEELPAHARARVCTDSQAVVWALSGGDRRKVNGVLARTVRIRDLIARKNLAIEIAWIPRRRNAADRLLRRYIASLCGTGGGESVYQRMKRL